MKKQHLYFFSILFFIFCSSDIFSKQNRNDSLLLVLNNAPNDSIKTQVFHELYLATDSIYFALEGLKLAESSNNKKGIAQALLDIGPYYYFNGKEAIALSYLIKCVKVAEEIHDDKILLVAYRYIGFIYRPNDPYVAEEYYNKSLKLSEKTKDEIAASYAYSALGNIYEGSVKSPTVDNKKALKYYLKSLEIRERKGSYQEIAASLNETARIYDALGENDKALILRIRGLVIAEKSGSKENVVYLSGILGNDYSFRLHDYKKGLAYQLKAYEIGKTLKNNFETMFDINKGIAYSYAALGDFEKSNSFYHKAIISNDSANSRKKKYDYNLSGIKHDLEKQLNEQKQLLKDSEILKEKAKADKQTTIRNASLIGSVLVLGLFVIVFRANRQKQKLNLELNEKNKKIETAFETLALSESKFKQITETITDVFYLYNIQEKKYEYISPNCLQILGLTQQYFYDGLSSKVVVHKDDLALVVDANVKIDSGIAYDIEYRIVIDGQIRWIAEKSSPIFNENGKLVRNSGICRDITRKKSNEEKIRKKNKDITDSILYAKTIQDAVLVPKEEMANRLRDFFVLYKPKEIVSGDFYFYKETDKGLYLAVADCTGHGVPAGFMSMLGSAFLNEIINEHRSITPSKILDLLRDHIIESLHQKMDLESKDGMDIAMLYFDNENSTVQYAGAFNPLYIVRDGELKEVKADLFPVGINFANSKPAFTNHKLQLHKGDTLYIFSDGYSDQFGGPNGRKFLKKQMQQLFLSIQDKSMKEQEQILHQTFVNWKGSLEQVDDVLVFGILI